MSLLSLASLGLSPGFMLFGPLASRVCEFLWLSDLGVEGLELWVEEPWLMPFAPSMMPYQYAVQALWFRFRV